MGNLVLNRLTLSGEVLKKFSSFVESNQEILVVFIPLFEEADNGGPGAQNIVTHRSACVEDNTDTYRRLVIRKMADSLFYFIFENPEMILIKADDITIQRISDSYTHQNCWYINSKTRGPLVILSEYQEYRKECLLLLL